MRIRTFFAAAALAGALASAAAALEVGAPAPDFGGTWFNHESTTLASLRGHVVLVEFMATW
jgi:hypothetical protein